MRDSILVILHRYRSRRIQHLLTYNEFRVSLIRASEKERAAHLFNRAVISAFGNNKGVTSVWIVMEFNNKGLSDVHWSVGKTRWGGQTKERITAPLNRSVTTITTKSIRVRGTWGASESFRIYESHRSFVVNNLWDRMGHERERKDVTNEGKRERNMKRLAAGNAERNFQTDRKPRESYIFFFSPFNRTLRLVILFPVLGRASRQSIEFKWISGNRSGSLIWEIIFFFFPASISRNSFNQSFFPPLIEIEMFVEWF